MLTSISCSILSLCSCVSKLISFTAKACLVRLSMHLLISLKDPWPKISLTSNWQTNSITCLLLQSFNSVAPSQMKSMHKDVIGLIQDWNSKINLWSLFLTMEGRIQTVFRNVSAFYRNNSCDRSSKEERAPPTDLLKRANLIVIQKPYVKPQLIMKY